MSRRILIVDDEEDVRRLAEISLTKVGGYDVTTAASGTECLEILTKERPDAILLDVMMPGLDGPETLAQIRSAGPTHDIPVVFITAGVAAADMDRLQTLAISGVLSKPFDPLALPGQLAAALGWPAP